MQTLSQEAQLSLTNRPTLVVFRIALLSGELK